METSGMEPSGMETSGMKRFLQPRWAPIGQYRTFPLPILPIPPPIPRAKRIYKKLQSIPPTPTKDKDAKNI
jgi:hypothetical protein